MRLLAVLRRWRNPELTARKYLANTVAELRARSCRSVLPFLNPPSPTWASPGSSPSTGRIWPPRRRRAAQTEDVAGYKNIGI